MKLHSDPRLQPRAMRFGVAAIVVGLLGACGGGGGDSGNPLGAPTVSSASADTPKYSQPMLVTINGTYLDAGLTVSSPACTNMTRSATAPYISTATTAYYRCTPSTLGAGQINLTRTADGFVLSTVGFVTLAPQVTMTVTNGAAVNGQLVFTLAPDKTPLTVDNFLAYVNSGFYNGTVFHRVLPGFVMQGGGYLPITPGAAPVLKPTNPPIALEVGKGLSNLQWSVAMARTNVLDSATSQFFVNVVDNVFLDSSGGGYAVFGTLSAGTATAAAILAAPCSAHPSFTDCVPNPNVVITTAVQSR